MDYEGLNRDQLKAEAAKRGLPVGGTVLELVERLRDHDADDLLSPAGPAGVSTPPPAERQPEPEPKPAPAEAPKVFQALYECPGELSTGVHQENLRRCWNDAAEAGYEPRGGAYGAARTGFRTEKGKRYAVYEIGLRR